ncbi:MAG: lysophospholipase, partial [Prevotellaceae bacterium]|nr:lysophospholipase [Prevotellaceae bacterium]
MNTRRNFLKKGALAGMGMMMLPELVRAAVNRENGVNAPKISLKNSRVILFQGDSITDCGRKRESNVCNVHEQLGSGYPLFTATQLLKTHADRQLKIYNRGVSGN